MKKNLFKRVTTLALTMALAVSTVVYTPAGDFKIVEAANGYVVVLDAGHGGFDPGTGARRSGGMSEKQMNLKIAQYCKAYLDANSDITTYMTRSDDSNPGTNKTNSLVNRCQLAKNKGANLLVSMHINAATSGYSAASGADIYIPYKYYNPEMKELGNIMLNNIRSTGMGIHAGLCTRLTENGTIYQLDGNGLPISRLEPGTAEYDSYTGPKVLADYLGITAGCTQRQIPSVLIEHGFMSNQSDEAFMNSEANLKALGEADAKAIISYYNANFANNDTDSTFNTSTTEAYVGYEAHCQSYGWRKIKYQGERAGTVGASKRLEALKVSLYNVTGGTINASAYISGAGWKGYSGDAKTGIQIGQTGVGNVIEGIAIDIADLPGYSIQYRVSQQNIGWSDWKENGAVAGAAGSGKRIESIEIKLLPKNTMSGVNNSTIGVAYQTQVQNYGWLNWVNDGAVSGTTGESKRMEAIKISLLNAPAGASVTARAHIQNYGWRNYSFGTTGTIGTQGESKRIEAMELTLNGVPGYSLEYRVHSQGIGWTKWYSQGQLAGTMGMSKRIEAIQVRVVPNTSLQNEPYVLAKAHVQTYGWKDWMPESCIVGTQGESKRVEAINLQVCNANGITVSGKVHVQNYGWLDYSNITSDTLLGTAGESKRVESINFHLNGTNKYKLQYRVHRQTYGWTDWVDEGNDAGTVGESKRLEAVEFRIVAK